MAKPKTKKYTVSVREDREVIYEIRAHSAAEARKGVEEFEGKQVDERLIVRTVFNAELEDK